MSASYCVSGSVFTLIEKKLHNSHKIAKDICNNFPEWGNWGLFVCFCCCCCCCWYCCCCRCLDDAKINLQMAIEFAFIRTDDTVWAHGPIESWHQFSLCSPLSLNSLHSHLYSRFYTPSTPPLYPLQPAPSLIRCTASALLRCFDGALTCFCVIWPRYTQAKEILNALPVCACVRVCQPTFKRVNKQAG